jgi:hypothetical protein
MTNPMSDSDQQTLCSKRLGLDIGSLRYRRVSDPKSICDGICPCPNHDLPLYVLDVMEPKGGN